MKLEYRYGQAYLVDLKPGDIIPTSDGNFTVLTENDIDENGMLKNNTIITNKTSDCLRKDRDD